MSTHAVGVDWSSGAWVAVAYGTDDVPDVAVFDTIREVWDAYGDAARRVVVDVPIGLCDSLDAASCSCTERDGELSRRCDDVARTVLGPRSSSVFTPPARAAAKLAADDREYAEVNAANRDRTGKGLMRQSANIAPAIVEVERLLLGAGDPAILVEGHPEVCFRAFAGAPLRHSKKTAPGADERLSALEGVEGYEAGDWRTLAAELRDEDRRVQLDDLLDALVLALTARAPPDQFRRLPPDPPTDPEGLPMQMVYRAEQSLPTGGVD